MRYWESSYLCVSNRLFWNKYNSKLPWSCTMSQLQHVFGWQCLHTEPWLQQQLHPCQDYDCCPSQQWPMYLWFGSEAHAVPKQQNIFFLLHHILTLVDRKNILLGLWLRNAILKIQRMHSMRTFFIGNEDKTISFNWFCNIPPHRLT